jgi:hypothetical protein
MVSPVFGGHGSRCAETFGRAVTRPSKLFAIRCRFGLGSSLALPICPPTEVGGYKVKAC